MWPVQSTFAKRRKHLNAISDLFVGRTIESVHYFDCVIDERDATFFELNSHTDHHEIMLGVDLIFDEGSILGFYWDAYREPGDYELHLAEKSCSELLTKKGGWKRIPMDDHPHLQAFVGQEISSFSFSRSLLAHPRDKSVCDCRIDLARGESFWICTRHLDGYRESADDLIVVFDEKFASKIGIQVDAR
jgi:hypothetical protein